MDAGGRDAGEGDAHLVYDSDYKTFTFVQTFAASGPIRRKCCQSGYQGKASAYYLKKIPQKLYTRVLATNGATKAVHYKP